MNPLKPKVFLLIVLFALGSFQFGIADDVGGGQMPATPKQQYEKAKTEAAAAINSAKQMIPMVELALQMFGQDLSDFDLQLVHALIGWAKTELSNARDDYVSGFGKATIAQGWDNFADNAQQNGDIAGADAARVLANQNWEAARDHMNSAKSKANQASEYAADALQIILGTPGQ